MDEISNPSKEPAKLRIWGRVLLKSCLEFQKNPAVFMAIVNLVFKKIPWFDSQNHLNTFDIFEKLVMNIVSVNPNYMIQAFKVLIDNLVSKSLCENEMEIDIVINDFKFSSQLELQDYIKEILANQVYHEKISLSGRQISDLSEDDHQFVTEFVKHHPQYQTKLKEMEKIVVGINQNYVVRSKCLFILKKDGSLEDISYLKCIQAIINQNNREKLQQSKNQIYKSGEQGLDLLVKLLKMNPISRKQFIKIYKEMYPHKKRNIYMLSQFLAQSLKLIIKCREIMKGVLETCMESLISIDSEISGSQPNNELYEEMPQKLDHLLDIFYEYIQFVFNPSESNKFYHSNTSKQETYVQDLSKNMLLIFQEQVLLANKLKYVQNIFLYLCLFYKQYPEVYQKLLSILICNIQNHKLSKIVKINSIYFLSAFLSIESIGEPKLFTKSFQVLIKFVEEYVHKYEKQFDLNFLNTNIDNFTILSTSSCNDELGLLGNKHQIFFVLIQGILHIFGKRVDVFDNDEIMFQGYQKLMQVVSKYKQIFYIYTNSLCYNPITELFQQHTIYQTRFEQIYQLLLLWTNQDTSKKSRNKTRKYKVDLYLPFQNDPSLSFFSSPKQALIAQQSKQSQQPQIQEQTQKQKQLQQMSRQRSGEDMNQIQDDGQQIQKQNNPESQNETDSSEVIKSNEVLTNSRL